jgi:hypothetical protein
MPEIAEVTEAVIISGPRRGEIIQLTPDLNDASTILSKAELGALDRELDRLIAALDRLTARVQRGVESMEGPGSAASDAD